MSADEKEGQHRKVDDEAGEEDLRQHGQETVCAGGGVSGLGHGRIIGALRRKAGSLSLLQGGSNLPRCRTSCVM